MNKRSMLTALIASTLLTGVALSPAIAGRKGGNCDGPDGARHNGMQTQRMEHRLGQMSTILDLTDVQQAQIKELFASLHEERQEGSRQRWEAKKQLHELKSARTFDEATFRSQAEKLASEKIDMQVQRMKTRQKIFDLLTAEQQEKAEILFQTMNNRGPGHGMKH